MEGEEAAALAAYRAARAQHPGLRLILVPRHAERFDSVAALARASRARRSCVGARLTRRRFRGARGLAAGHPGRHDRRAGGGLGPGRRGVRRREPAARPGRPEHDGAGRLRRVGAVRPAHRQFRETVEQLLARNAARQVADAAELTRRPARRPRRPRGRRRARRRRPDFVLAQNGAAGRTLAELDRLVESSLAEQIGLNQAACVLNDSSLK